MVRRPRLPDSIALLVWMVALIPLAFASLVAAVLLTWCEESDCHSSNVGLWVWAGGILAALLSTLLPARRLALAVATAALVAPFVLVLRLW
jgi:hypothetical protein